MATNIGDVARITGTFYLKSGTAVDPTTVTCVVHFPNGSSTTYTSVSNPAVTKDSTGNYHLDLALTLAGVHLYRWVGTGTNAAAEPGSFTVDADAF